MDDKATKRAEADRNPDPLSGEPGAHPVGVGIGSMAGAAAGAAVGAVAGPAGAAVGAAVGGLVGGLAGKTAAEAVNPSMEDAYWEENYASRSYVKPGVPYDEYRAAYRHGWEARGRYGELSWEDVEPRLREEWARYAAESGLTWDEASPAARDAFDRLRPEERYGREER
jgi:hypothetical protein